MAKADDAQQFRATYLGFVQVDKLYWQDVVRGAVSSLPKQGAACSVVVTPFVIRVLDEETGRRLWEQTLTYLRERLPERRIE